MIGRPWTKTRTSATTIRTGTRDSVIQEGENINVLRSPGSVIEGIVVSLVCSVKSGLQMFFSKVNFDIAITVLS